ncbi:MAG: proton-conducting transporter membrane subunit [Bacteroidota bacterium]|nr:proton-conducting transporter membrane subunit [Bacteroidota bacterium]
MILYYFIASILIIAGALLSRNKTLTALLAGGFIAGQAVFTAYMLDNRNLTELGYFTFDSTAIILMILLSVLSIATFYHGLVYLKDEQTENFNIYHAGFIALIASITGVYLANNIMVTWIFLEATTLSVAALIYHHRTIRTLEATWKYVFICSTGIALAYVGILLLGISIKGVPGADLSYQSLTHTVVHTDPVYLKLAFIFLLIGFSAKMEVFPLYTIGIDANYVAPAPVSAFISTALVNAGFCAIFRVFKIFTNSAVASWTNGVLIITGLISLLIVAGYMQRVKNFKRLFAYSTVENMGLVLLAIGMGGIGYYAAFLHIVLHSLTKSSLFYQMGQAHKILQTYKIFKTGSYLKLYPVGALVLLLGLIVITAIPPSGMFVSEVLIFKSMFAGNNWWIFIVTALLLCFVIYGMSTKVLLMIFTPLEKEIQHPVKVNPFQSMSQYILLGVVIWFCFSQPAFLVELLTDAAKIVK